MVAKTIFLSDVHVGAKRYSDESKDKGRYAYDWDWLTEAQSQNFISFLEFLHADPAYKSVSEIVLLGDIFDNWIFPHDLVPPSLDEVLDANDDIRTALQELSAEHDVFYVPGNHDMGASREFMERHFPRITYCPERFNAGRVVAEHGHRYALFNAPATFSHNLYGLPLGYFMSRLEATKKGRTNREGRHYRTYVDDFLELVTKATLPQCALDAVLEEVGLCTNTEFVVKLDDGSIVRPTAADVREIYKDIYEDWPTATVSKPRAAMAELDRLNCVADLLCKNGKAKVCVFGHSHKAEIDKDTWFCDDRIYANSGYWCGNQCTFVEIEGTYTVRLVRWIPPEGVRTLVEETV